MPGSFGADPFLQIDGRLRPGLPAVARDALRARTGARRFEFVSVTVDANGKLGE